MLEGRVPASGMKLVNGAIKHADGSVTVLATLSREEFEAYKEAYKRIWRVYRGDVPDTRNGMNGLVLHEGVRCILEGL